jgi:23S rRNA pseudouridine1911/1915/1917 synthase
MEQIFTTIYENEDYLVINKPAGLTVHGGAHIKEKTLVDFLLEKYPDLKNVGEDPDRPAIVHRLDKEASGLMIIPKNNKSFEYFKELFKSRKIEKEYIALVHGKLSKDEDLIDFPIKRSSQGHKMAAVPRSKDYSAMGESDEIDKSLSNRGRGNIKALEKSRQAITEFNVIKKLINFTLVKVRIKTGRTHQIRVHFSAYGHPLLGDALYGNKKSKVKNAKVNLGRIFLEACRLSFVDPQGEKQEFKINLSSDLENVLQKVK